MSDHLPRDMLIDILTRLPIKSLLKSRCVCKSWNSLILSSAFVTAHLNRDRHPLVLLKYFGNDSISYSLHFDDKSFRNYLNLDSPNEIKLRYLCLVGSCNGVLCLVDNFNPRQNNLILWNPSIRKMLKVPQPGFSHPTMASPYQVMFGFGFVSASNDYKIVRIMNIRKYNLTTKRKFIRPVEVEIYSLNAGSWKRVDSSSLGLFHMRYINFIQAFVNGIVHWLVFREVNGKKKVFVLSFDLDVESIDEIMLPESLASSNLRSISVLQKSLVLFEDTGGCCYHMWVMREYGVEESWTKEFSIDLGESMTHPTAFRKNGDLLIQTRSELISFNAQSQAILGKFSACSYADCYTESLVLLKELDDKRCDETASMKRKERLLHSSRGVRLRNGSLVTGNKDEVVVSSQGEVVDAGNGKAVAMDLDTVASPRQEARFCCKDISIRRSKRKSVSIEQHTDLSEANYLRPVLYRDASGYPWIGYHYYPYSTHR